MRSFRFVAGLLVAAGFPFAGAAADDAILTDITWLAEDIEGRGVVDNVASTFRIDASGKLSGAGGCNRISGTAKIAGEKIAIAPPATTRMMCPPAVMDQEQKFLGAITRARSYKLEGSILRLQGEDGAELLRLVKSD